MLRNPCWGHYFTNFYKISFLHWVSKSNFIFINFFQKCSCKAVKVFIFLGQGPIWCCMHCHARLFHLPLVYRTPRISPPHCGNQTHNLKILLCSHVLYCCATTAGLPSDTLKPSRRFQLATFPRPVRSSHDLWKSKFYFYDWSETNLFCWMVPRLLTGTQSSIENSFQWSTFIGGRPGSSGFLV